MESDSRIRKITNVILSKRLFSKFPSTIFFIWLSDQQFYVIFSSFSKLVKDKKSKGEYDLEINTEEQYLPLLNTNSTDTTLPNNSRLVLLLILVYKRKPEIQQLTQSRSQNH